MKLDVNSNGYTFTFAAILVVVVAALLSWTSISLQERQEANIAQEKKQNILASIGLSVERTAADAMYEQVIVEEAIIVNGKKSTGADVSAFNVNMADEVKKPVQERKLPLYVAENEGSRSYIIPLRGKGLWGPIWGYVALKDDLNTVIGATFDHKAETPGLGAEISTGIFQDPFSGKQIMEAGSFVSIEVRKGDANGPHQVNGISGGTITSVGVDAMLKDCLAGYQSYFDQIRSTTALAPSAVEDATTTF